MPAHNAKDVTGQRFGRLVALKRGPTQGKKATWLCRCDCGTEKLAQYWSLVAGYTKSCGCLRQEIAKRGDGNRKHAMKGSSEYRIWATMKQRCHNPNFAGFRGYGARGIAVCEEWRNDFAAFYRDVGPRPSPDHTLDRIDNDGGYCPGNVRWATRVEQQNNRRNTRLIEAFGKRQNARAWAQDTGLKASMIYMRVFARGWSAERALTTPTHGLLP